MGDYRAGSGRQRRMECGGRLPLHEGVRARLRLARSDSYVSADGSIDSAAVEDIFAPIVERVVQLVKQQVRQLMKRGETVAVRTQSPCFFFFYFLFVVADWLDYG